jgi:hypothetical protein
MTVEQLDAVEDFLAGDNVTIRANYGSGKTTTIMHAYNEVERVGGQALCMVYNSSMKLEMRSRVSVESRAYVHTIHSAAQYFFHDVNGSTDHGILKALKAKVSDDGTVRLRNVTHVMIDEAQDLKPLFYDFIRKLVRTIKRLSASEPTIMLVGDVAQEVNRWNHADSRFLSLAPHLGYNTKRWKIHELTKTFRCPQEVVLANNLITGLKVVPHKSASVDGKSKPRLGRCDLRKKGVDNRAYKRIREWLDEGYEYEDILVLVPSLKKGSMAAKLQHVLGRQKIPTYQPNSDDKEPGDDSYLKGKIRFCTYHACKGLESPCVLAISFDSAAKWLHNGYDDFDLAPPYHVAMTRCKERLTLLQHHESPDLRAFQNVGLERMAEIFNLESYDADHIETPVVNDRPIDVTKFIDTLTSTSIQEAVDILDVQKFEYAPFCNAPGRVPSTSHKSAVEDVSSLNGYIAEIFTASLFKVPFKEVPAMMNMMVPGIAGRILDLSFDQRMDMRLEFASTKEDITTELAVKTATIAAMVHHFKENGFTTHLHQIRDKYWWTEEYRQEVFKVVTDAMDHVDPGWSAWSWGMERLCRGTVKGYDVVGRADFYSYKNAVVELKYTSAYKNSHLIQLLIYAHCLNAPTGTECVLINCRTGECCRYVLTKSITEKAIDVLKVQSELQRISDIEFLQKYA